MTDSQKQSALTDILSALAKLPAKTTYYAASAGAIALLASGVDPNTLPPAIGIIASGLGINLLSGMIDRIANGETLSEDDIAAAVRYALNDSKLEDRLNDADFRQVFTDFTGGWTLTLIANLIQTGQQDIAERLIDQITAMQDMELRLSNQLASEFAALRRRLDQLKKSEPIIKVLDEIPVAVPKNTHIFISYARRDGSEASLRLYNDLLARGIPAWRDNRIDPTVDFTGEIEAGINNASHVVVVLTADLKRETSFVRLEIGYALDQKKPIVPLMFPGGHRPIVIVNHTYVNFADWDVGFRLLLERLKNPNSQEIDPQTRREYEIAYLQHIGQKYEDWRDFYTELAASARIEEPKVKLKSGAERHLAKMDLQHHIHQRIDHSPEADKGKTVKTESLSELSAGIRNYKRVALIGDPGAGKTTTLERLAYEYATTAAEETQEPYQLPLPLFVRLGAYTGEEFNDFLAAQFTGLLLLEYLPQRLVLLLDGLNEMPPDYHSNLEAWLRENPQVAVIVSCRKLDYVDLKLPLQRVDVAPLDLERIRLFMGNYLEDVEREMLFWALAGYDARRAWHWYQQRKENAAYSDFFYGEDKHGNRWIPEGKLLDGLRQQWRDDHKLPDMLDVVTNPFLMQIVIEIYALSGEPPRNKGDLFGQFVALLMAERGKTAIRPDRVWIAEATQQQALAALAYRMQIEKTGTSVSVDFVRDTFQQAAPGTDATLLLYFAVSASILEQTDSVRFSHQLLQEYFAAYEMGEDLRRGVPATRYFPSDEWWTPTGWEETALLLAGMQGNATRVVEWLTPIQPDLAYRVATESGTECDSARLQKLYEPADGARRSPYAIAEWGRLNHEQDSRPGVGVVFLPSPVGEGSGVRAIPDIAWCDVPMPPAGKVWLGADDESDNPRREVAIPYSFKMAKYPITYRQFQAFVDSGEFTNPEWWDKFPPEYQPQAMAEQYNPYWNHPRDWVSWYQAVAFTKWLTAKYNELGLWNALTPDPSPTGEGRQAAGEMSFTGEENRAMASKAMIQIARDLRQRQTSAEALLWECLRDRRLANLKFRRQHPVANTTYVADFFCYEHRLVIELDGGIHSSQQTADTERQRVLEAQGLQVLRFPNDMLYTQLEEVLITILQITQDSPLPLGEGQGVRAEWQIHLPTEWEWQWVAQNGVEARIYPWGEWDDYPRANTTEAGIGDRSIAVGMYPYGATECGAFDVAGNLWEWCLNDYDNPEITNGHSNNNKTLRGGSFHGYRTLARAGYRGSSSPGYWGLNRGFRVDVALLLPSLSSGTLDSDSL